MSYRPGIRQHLAPSFFLGGAVGLVLMGVLFRCGVPAGAAIPAGWALGFGLVLLMLRRI